MKQLLIVLGSLILVSQSQANKKPVPVETVALRCEILQYMEEGPKKKQEEGLAGSFYTSKKHKFVIELRETKGNVSLGKGKISIKGVAKGMIDVRVIKKAKVKIVEVQFLSDDGQYLGEGTNNSVLNPSMVQTPLTGGSLLNCNLVNKKRPTVVKPKPRKPGYKELK